MRTLTGSGELCYLPSIRKEKKNGGRIQSRAELNELIEVFCRKCLRFPLWPPGLGILMARNIFIATTAEPAFIVAFPSESGERKSNLKWFSVTGWFFGCA